jgi:hypothetical protein
VVWSTFAACAEILWARWTAYSELCHMICGMLRNNLSLLILLLVVRLRGFKHENVFTFTANPFRIHVNTYIHLPCFDLVKLLAWQHFSDFFKWNNFWAAHAACIFKCDLFIL